MERRISIDPIDDVDSNNNSNSTAPSILDGPYWQLDSNRPRTRRSRSTPPVSSSRTRRSAETSGSHETPVSVAIDPMAAAMEAALSSLLEDILLDPPDGPIRQSFNAVYIESTMDLISSENTLLEALTYDNAGTDTAIPPLRITKIKHLRDFLKDRDNQKLTIDSSSFVLKDVRRFISSGATITAPPAPASVVHAIQADFVATASATTTSIPTMSATSVVTAPQAQQRNVAPADRRGNNIESDAIIIPSTPGYIAPVGSQVHTGCFNALLLYFLLLLLTAYYLLLLYL